MSVAVESRQPHCQHRVKALPVLLLASVSKRSRAGTPRANRLLRAGAESSLPWSCTN